MEILLAVVMSRSPCYESWNLLSERHNAALSSGVIEKEAEEENVALRGENTSAAIFSRLGETGVGLAIAR